MTKEEQKQQLKANRMRKMGLLYFILLGVAGAAILWFTIRIQWIDGAMWREKAKDLRGKLITVPAQRGSIYSSDGNILVSTVKVADLWIDFGTQQELDKMGKPKVVDGKPVRMPILADTAWDQHIDEVCALLHSVRPERSQAEWRAKLEQGRKSGSRCFNVQNNLPFSTWERIRTLKGWNACVVKMVDIEYNEGGRRTVAKESVVREKRVPTFGGMARNVLGVQNERTLKTYTGLEGAYDSVLRGQDGLYFGRRIRRDMYLPDDIDDTVRLDSTHVAQPVINGSHIIATLDSRYQDVAETALAKMLARYGGASGCAVLMDIETGYVLACANLTRDTSGLYYEHPFNNVALSHIYEPGSTFKTVVLTAMLNDQMVDTTFRVRTGFKTYPDGTYIEDSRGHTAADTATVQQAFIHSSNVGLAELGYIFYRGQRMRLCDSVRAIFPYLADGKLHLDLNSPEYAARITDPKLSLNDFLHFCYGYANMVSPMQVLTFYNAMAHPKRQLMKPQFCKAIIRGRDTIPQRPITLMKGRPICSAETQAIMIDLLTHVVEEGTATNLKNDTYLIAGKTGTANTVYGMRGGQQNNGSFVGFFPADRPKYSCIVVGEGIGQMNGRQTAVVFKEIADCVMAMDRSLGNISFEKVLERIDSKQLGREPWVKKARQMELMRAYGLLGLPYPSSDSSSMWSTFAQGVDSLGTTDGYAPYALPSDLIPDCTGMTAREAVALLKQMGLKVKLQGVGRVKSQFPQGRTRFSESTIVTLNLSNQ